MQEFHETSPRLQEQVRAGYAAVKEQVGKTAGTIREEVGAASRVAKEELSAVVDEKIGQARDAARYSADRTATMWRNARSTMQSNPEKWLLIAMGAGVMLGLCAQLITRAGERQSRY